MFPAWALCIQCIVNWLFTCLDCKLWRQERFLSWSLLYTQLQHSAWYMMSTQWWFAEWIRDTGKALRNPSSFTASHREIYTKAEAISLHLFLKFLLYATFCWVFWSRWSWEDSLGKHTSHEVLLLTSQTRLLPGPLHAVFCSHTTLSIPHVKPYHIWVLSQVLNFVLLKP